MTIDYTKPVETDQNTPRKVRVLCMDRAAPGSIVLAVSDGHGQEDVMWANPAEAFAYLFGLPGFIPLRNVRERTEGWWWRDSSGSFYGPMEKSVAEKQCSSYPGAKVLCLREVFPEEM